MAIAQLSIDLVAKIAQFEADLKRSTAATEAAAGRMAAAFGIVKAAAGGLAGAFTLDFVKSFVTRTADGIDKLNDLADATGSTVENLSALEDAARRTGTGIDVVGDALVKLNKSLSGATISSDTARALQAIGLSAAELRKQDPTDALQRVAVALSGYADGQRKAEVVQELFGKSLKEVAPLLNDLATVGRRAATVTAEQAKEAEKFNQELAAMSKNSEDTSRAMVSFLLPSINAFLKDINLARQAYGGFVAALLDNTGPQVLGNTAERIAQTSERIAGLRKSMENADAGKTKPLFADQRRAMEDEITFLNKRLTYLKALQAESVNQADYSNEGRKALAKPGIKDFKVDPEVKKAQDEYLKLAQSIGQAGEAASAEIVTGEKQSELLKVRAKVLEVLTSGQFMFTRAQRDSLKAAADSLVVLDDEVKLFKTRQEVQRQSLQLSTQQLASLASEHQARAQANQDLRNQAEEFGKTADQVERLRIAREEDAAAQEELTILGLQNIEGTEQEVAARQRNVDVLREQIRLRRQLLGQNEEARTSAGLGAQRAVDEYLLRVSEAGVATEQAVGRAIGSLEDNLTTALAGGKADVRSFVNSVLQEMIRLQVVKPLLASIFKGSKGSAWDAIFGNSNQNPTGGSDIPKNFDGLFASGGILGAGKWGIAGENGPEPIIGPAQVVSNKTFMQASAPPVQYTVVVQGDASENTLRLINGALAQFQARQMRGAI